MDRAARLLAPPRSARASVGPLGERAVFRRHRRCAARSCITRRPAPILVWPTSELPIWPSGRPTARPEVASSACGHSRIMRSKFGVLAARMALSLRLGPPAPAIENAKNRGSLTRGSLCREGGLQDSSQTQSTALNHEGKIGTAAGLSMCAPASELRYRATKRVRGREFAEPPRDRARQSLPGRPNRGLGPRIRH